MAINFEASDFTLSYRKVVQIALVSEITMAKKLVFTLKSNAETVITSIMFVMCCG